jgi:hypothetical protein
VASVQAGVWVWTQSRNQASSARELVIAAALAAALGAPAVAGREPLHLLGRPRGSFDAAGPLDLIGLGARPWRSASGYLGLTVLFRELATGRFLTWSDTRPTDGAGWDPVTRYRAAGPWNGLPSPSAVVGRRVVLVGALVSGSGRLSGSASTSATVAPAPPELAAALAPQASWPELVERFAASRRSLLAAPESGEDWVVLAPAAFAPARFDENRQVVRWPMLDAEGRRLTAEVRCGYTTAVIDRIERLSERTPTGTLVVARLVQTPDGLMLDPLSLVHPGPGPDGSGVEALALPGTAPGSESSGSRPGGSVGVGVEVEELKAAPVDVVAGGPRSISDLRSWIGRTAERGLSPSVVAERAEELGRLVARAASAGLTAFRAVTAAPTHEPGDLAGRLLRVHAVCLQYERLAAYPYPIPTLTPPAG